MSTDVYRQTAQNILCIKKIERVTCLCEISSKYFPWLELFFKSVTMSGMLQKKGRLLLEKTNFYHFQICSLDTFRASLEGERVTLASWLHVLAHSHISSFFLRWVDKTARVTWVGRLPYLGATVTLAGMLTFFLVNTPGRVNLGTWVNFLIVPRPFECNCASRLSQVVGLPHNPVKFCL